MKIVVETADGTYEVDWPCTPAVDDFVELEDHGVRGWVYAVLWTQDRIIVKLRSD